MASSFWRFYPAQSVELRADHFFHLLALLLNLADRGADADGGHVDNIRGEPKSVNPWRLATMKKGSDNGVASIVPA